MKKLIYLILFVAFLPLAQVEATHVAGGSITYRNVGPNQYTVRLTLFRDCGGANIPPFTTATQTVWYRNGCGGAPVPFTVNWLPGTGFEVPTPCVDDPSTCSGGSRYGILRFDWEGTVTLPFNTTTPTCNEWWFSWGSSATNANIGHCCRNTNQTLGGGLGQANFFIDSYLNNNFTPGNNSAYYGSFEVPAYCVNEPVVVRLDVAEDDADSLTFGLVPALQAWNTPAPYAAGRTPAVPAAVLNNIINIDSTNGNISFFSLQSQTAVFVMRVSEYRNGTLIGYVNLDVQVLTGVGRFCDNVQPGFRFDTVAVNCGTWNDLEMTVDLRSRIQCNTVSTDASEFRLYSNDGQLVQLKSATPLNCDAQDRTLAVRLELARPLDENGAYYLVSRNGTDGNTLGNQCDKFMATFDTMAIIVTGCPEYRKPMTITNVSVDTLNPNHTFVMWELPDTLNFNWFLAYNMYRALPGENIFSLDQRKFQFLDVNQLMHYDWEHEVFPHQSPIRYNMNLVLINGKENARSNTVQSIRLKNEPATTEDDDFITIDWTPYNGWETPEYMVQWFEGNKPLEGWKNLVGPLTDTTFTYEKPKPRGVYRLRVLSKKPGSILVSYSNPIDFTVPGRDIDIPNVITPNGDGINDKFEIENLEYYPGSKLFIYNRWGQQLYASNDYRNDWGGETLESGNYFYHLIVTDPESFEDTDYKGVIKIMR
jgi:gliding motility-associated-like protein